VRLRIIWLLFLEILTRMCVLRADIEACNNRGCMPLHLEACHCRISVMKELIEVRNVVVNANVMWKIHPILILLLFDPITNYSINFKSKVESSSYLHTPNHLGHYDHPHHLRGSNLLTWFFYMQPRYLQISHVLRLHARSMFVQNCKCLVQA
jgi:hypothetical protein